LNLTKALEPKNLDEFIGQTHLLDKNKPLYKLIEQKELPNIFLYGPLIFIDEMNQIILNPNYAIEIL